MKTSIENNTLTIFLEGRIDTSNAAQTLSSMAIFKRFISDVRKIQVSFLQMMKSNSSLR